MTRDPQVIDYAHRVQTGNLPFTQVPGPLRDQVRIALSEAEAGGTLVESVGRFLVFQKAATGRQWAIETSTDDIVAWKRKHPYAYGAKFWDTQTETWVQPGKRGPVKDKSSHLHDRPHFPTLFDPATVAMTMEEYREKMTAGGNDIWTSWDADDYMRNLRNAVLMGHKVPPAVRAQLTGPLIESAPAVGDSWNTAVNEKAVPVGEAESIDEAKAGTELYHTTNALTDILRTRTMFSSGGYVSFAELPVYSDISGNLATLVFDTAKLRNQVEKVEYSEDWYDAHRDQAAYIAGEGWREQYTAPDYEDYPSYDPDDDEWEPDSDEDQEFEQNHYRDAELSSFLHKASEREWISKGGEVRFSRDAVKRIIVPPKNLEKVKAMVARAKLDVPVVPMQNKGGRRWMGEAVSDSTLRPIIARIRELFPEATGIELAGSAARGEMDKSGKRSDIDILIRLPKRPDLSDPRLDTLFHEFPKIDGRTADFVTTWPGGNYVGQQRARWEKGLPTPTKLLWGKAYDEKPDRERYLAKLKELGLTDEGQIDADTTTTDVRKLQMLATAMAKKAARVFGIPLPTIRFVDGEDAAYGEGNGSIVFLQNGTLGRPAHKVVMPAVQKSLTAGEHVASHEVVHAVFAHNPQVGHAILKRLQAIKSPNGGAVSLNGAWNGDLENLIDLGALYVHSPDALRRYSAEMFSLASEWAQRVSGRAESIDEASDVRSVQARALKLLPAYVAASADYVAKRQAREERFIKSLRNTPPSAKQREADKAKLATLRAEEEKAKESASKALDALLAALGAVDPKLSSYARHIGLDNFETVAKRVRTLHLQADYDEVVDTLTRQPIPFTEVKDRDYIHINGFGFGSIYRVTAARKFYLEADDLLAPDNHIRLKSSQLQGGNPNQMRTGIQVYRLAPALAARAKRVWDAMQRASADVAEAVPALPGSVNEVAPPGFSGSVRAMQDKHGFDAAKAHKLAWSMYSRGARPHYRPEPGGKGIRRYLKPKTYARLMAKRQGRQS